jgi:hypothetical protein
LCERIIFLSDFTTVTRSALIVEEFESDAVFAKRKIGAIIKIKKYFFTTIL